MFWVCNHIRFDAKNNHVLVTSFKALSHTLISCTIMEICRTCETLGKIYDDHSIEGWEVIQFNRLSRHKQFLLDGICCIFSWRPDRSLGTLSAVYSEYRVYPNDKAAGAGCEWFGGTARPPLHRYVMGVTFIFFISVQCCVTILRAFGSFFWRLV